MTLYFEKDNVYIDVNQVWIMGLKALGAVSLTIAALIEALYCGLEKQ